MLLGTQHNMTDQLSRRLSLATTLRIEMSVLSQHDYPSGFALLATSSFYLRKIWAAGF